MPVITRWFNEEQTTLLMSIEGAWVFDEMWEAYSRGLDRIRAIDRVVHVIVDHTLEGEVPEGFGALVPKFGALDFPPNVGLIIHVGSKGATRTGQDLFSMMYRKLHSVDLMEDAVALIRVYEERKNVSGAAES